MNQNISVVVKIILDRTNGTGIRWQKLCNIISGQYFVIPAMVWLLLGISFRAHFFPWLKWSITKMQQNYIPRKVFCISVKSLIPQCQFDFNSNLGHVTVKSSLPPKTMRHIVSIIFLFIKTLILERKKLQLYKMKPLAIWQNWCCGSLSVMQFASSPAFKPVHPCPCERESFTECYGL